MKSEPGENGRILPSITSALQKHVLHKRLDQYPLRKTYDNKDFVNANALITVKNLFRFGQKE